MRILEEFWYGNIVPTEYKKLLELICRNEEKLHAAMTNRAERTVRKIHRLCVGSRPSQIA